MAVQSGNIQDMRNAAKLSLTMALCAAISLLALSPPAHAALSDTLAQASSTSYVFDHPKTGNVPSRRVVANISTPGSGGSVTVEKTSDGGITWSVEVGPFNSTTDTALDTSITNQRSFADTQNANEEAAQLLTDSAEAVILRLAAAGAPQPSQAQMESAMNPAPGGQTVFNLVRK